MIYSWLYTHLFYLICYLHHNHLQLQNHQKNYLKFTKTVKTGWQSVRGRIIHEIIKFDMGIVKDRNPKGIILLAGGNDETEETSVEDMASALISFISLLTITYGV